MRITRVAIPPDQPGLGDPGTLLRQGAEVRSIDRSSSALGDCYVLEVPTGEMYPDLSGPRVDQWIMEAAQVSVWGNGRRIELNGFVRHWLDGETGDLVDNTDGMYSRERWTMAMAGVEDG